jgi:hypothetical protein
MILFFDKNIGTGIPIALQNLEPPFKVEYHQQHFALNELDDKWLPVVGRNHWTVIGHDRKFHEKESELDALTKYKIGCFYLWGANAKKWEKIKVFFKACDRIVEAEANTPRPFIYKVKRNGGLRRIKLPRQQKASN